MKISVRLKASDVIDLLKARYAPPAYAFLEQVADGTGSNQKRWADAVVMSVWPSRGYTLEGFEVKVNRSDWLSEMRNPEKAEQVQRFCNYWTLVVSDPAIVQPGELPATWGLMAVIGGKLKCITQPPVLSPEPITLPFMASLLRNFASVDGAKVQQAYERGRREGYDSGGLHWKERHTDLSKALEEFEQKSGLKINSWNAGQVGDAVALMERLKDKRESLATSAAQARRVADILDEMLAKPGFRDMVAQEFPNSGK